MMKRVKRLTALLLACLLSISLMACNEKPAEGGSGQGKVQSNTEMKIPKFQIDNPVLKSIGTTELPEDIDETYAKFKTLTGHDIRIEHEVVSWAEYQSKLAVMVMSDQAPDLFGIERVISPWIIRKDVFEPLDELVNWDDPLWSGLKNELGKLTYKGKVYGIPSDNLFAMQSVLYNTDLVEEAGLEDPRKLYYEGKWDWDKFLEYAEELTQDTTGDGQTDIYGVAMPDYASMYFTISTGKDIVTLNADGTVTNNLRDPNFVRVYDFIYRLYQAKTVHPVSWQAMKDFQKSKVAMFVGQFWATTTDMNEMKKAGKVSFAPIPKDPKADKHYTFGWASDNFIPKGAKNVQGALAWYTVSRYLSLNPTEEDKAKIYKMRTEEWGWNDEDIKLGYTDMQKDMVKLEVIGDRMPNFNKFLELWNQPANEPWSVVIERVYPALDEAISKLDK